MKEYNFIRTKDSETKSRLIKEGFQLVSDNDGVATFINDMSNMKFNDNPKVQYTNMLCI